MRSGTVGAGDERLVREALFYRPQEGGREGWSDHIPRKNARRGFAFFFFS